MQEEKEPSRRHYNLGVRPEKLFFMKLPGQQIWKQAILSGEYSPRSYEVRVNGTTYR